MRKLVAAIFATLFLTGCAGNDSMGVYSFDARTQDVALENVTLVSDGKEVYVQPTFDLFWIEKLSTKEEPVKAAAIELYNEGKELFYSFAIGENQNGILDTRTTALDGELIGSIMESGEIKAGNKIYVVFSYEKGNTPVAEEIEVILEKE